jgi:hypothetical protein
MGNLPINLIKAVNSTLKQTDGSNLRIETGGGTLVCDFCRKRFIKDKHEMENQIKKAREAVNQPARIRRIKFIKGRNGNEYSVNKELIEKQRLVLGIKGYYTNLPDNFDNMAIIRHYHNLWHVEQTFRMAKNDLEMRPIYHYKESRSRLMF